MEIISMKCPSCGASITTQTKQCEYCGSDILIKSFKNLAAMSTPQVNKYMANYRSAAEEHPDSKDLNTSIGLCFLKLRKYDQAIEYLEKAQAENFDDATPFFYTAVARLKGKKPFLLNRPEIDKIMEDIQAAMDIEPSAEQYYFMSYIKRDYFKRKFLNTTPTWEEYMQEAVDNGLTPADVEEFHAMTGTPVDIEL
jgi:tetratricopeptide (TPR) repeat protein